MTQHSHNRWAVTMMLALLAILPFSMAPAFAQPQYTVPIVLVNTSFLNVRSGPGVQYSTLVTLVGGTELPVLGVGSDGVWYLVSTPIGIGWVNVEFTLPRGNFSVVPSINVNALEAQLIAPASAPTIALDAGQGGGSIATTTSTVERFRGFLVVDNINLRVAPTDGAGAITILRTGVDRLTDFAIVGRSRDANNLEWVALDVPNFGIGWVESDKVVTRLSARYATVVTVTATEFGLTSGPAGGNLPDPVVLQRDDEAFLVGVSSDSLYAQVELADGRVGWLPFSVVSTRGGTTSDILRSQGDTAEALAALGQGGGDAAGQTLVFPRLDVPHVVVNTSSLNVRSGPGSQFSVVATLAGGTELEAAGIFEDGFWFLVRGSFGTGWVDTDFVLFRGSIDNVPTITAAGAASLVTIDVQVPVAIFSTSLTLYAAPGTNFGAVGFVNGPGELPVVARTSDGRWVQLSTPTGFGWVLADQVIVRGDPNLIPVVG